MKNYAHLTPRYIISRLSEMYYHKTEPNLPWLTKDANAFLSSYLLSSDVGLEFGSGRSTVWFAKQVKHLISVEHNGDWHQNVRKMLADNNHTNIDYRHLSADKPKDGAFSPYVAVVETIDPSSIDFVLVDGEVRGACALHSIGVLRSGGIMIIDNVNWFLPSNSISPNSRTFTEGPRDADWDAFQKIVDDWRTYWTSSGVSDTAIYFKP